MSAEELRARIREIPDFPKPGILFYDITTLLKDPVAYKESIDLMLEPWRTDKVDLVVGMESRGFIFSAPMAYLLIADHLDETANATAAGVFARTHRRHPEPPARRDHRPGPDPSRLARLGHQWDAHPAKLVEAALRGHRLTGDAAFGDAVAGMMA